MFSKTVKDKEKRKTKSVNGGDCKDRTCRDKRKKNVNVRRIAAVGVAGQVLRVKSFQASVSAQAVVRPEHAGKLNGQAGQMSSVATKREGVVARQVLAGEVTPKRVNKPGQVLVVAIAVAIDLMGCELM
jgi:hypothetical protein